MLLLLRLGRIYTLRRLGCVFGETGERYRMQLLRLNRILHEKRPQYEQRHENVILQQDNARPHVAKPVKTYMETLKWEVLPHPPDSPKIAASDY